MFADGKRRWTQKINIISEKEIGVDLREKNKKKHFTQMFADGKRRRAQRISVISEKRLA